MRQKSRNINIGLVVWNDSIWNIRKKFFPVKEAVNIQKTASAQ